MQIKRKQAAALLAAGILLLAPSKLTAEVAGKIYGNDRIPEEQISIYVETPLGLRSRVDTRDCSIKDYHYGGVDVLDFS